MDSLRNPKSLLVQLHDVVAAAIAWYFAFLLQFNFELPLKYSATFLNTLIWVVPLQAFVFRYFGLYRGVWRFASLPDLKRILNAVIVSTLLMSAVLLLLHPLSNIPRSVLILDPMILLMTMGGNRLLYRLWKEHRLYRKDKAGAEPVLIIGSGEAAVSLIKDLERDSKWLVAGLLDNRAERQGRDIRGVKVLGGLDQLAEMAERFSVSQVIIAMPSAAHESRRRVVDIVTAAGLRALTVPSVNDLISGRVNISNVREVEVEDLLGRDPVQLDDTGLFQQIGGQVVMVTGAGGSIGTELCRQISRFQPRLLVLFELSEFALYQLEQEFRERLPNQQIVCIVGDVRNRRRVDDILRRYQPSLVVHAAAYKHVPLMEWGNVYAALDNNILGTYTLASACKEAGVHKFVLISTDKAVNPTNVMGASKRLAEMVCQGLQEESATRFIMVRFGNVLGSSGSVIPKFRQQLADGVPLTVTHPEVTRYFMSIPEASQLVLQAGLMGHGGEIFVLDMGEPIKISDLAKEMIRLSGRNPEEARIVYTGLRPGEKLYEELLAHDEHTIGTPHPKLRIAQARVVGAEWLDSMLKWVESSMGKDEVLIKQELHHWLGEYQCDQSYEATVPASLLFPATLH